MTTEGKSRVRPDTDAAARFADRHGADIEHARAVMRFSEDLFRGLKSLHGYAGAELNLLRHAAILHDIGYCRSARLHHIHSMRMILAATDLIPEMRERLALAAIARYHRRELPTLLDPCFRKLSPGDRQRVKVLAAILKVADGLECGHNGRVSRIKCRIGRRIRIFVCLEGEPAFNVKKARRKSDLMEIVFFREVKISLKPSVA